MIPVLILAACTLPFVISGCMNVDASDGDNPGASDSESGRAVRVAEVVVGDVEKTITRASTISAPNTITVLPRISGQIVDLKIQEGQKISAGDVIAQLDDAELLITEQKFKTLMDKAEHDMKLAEVKYKREIATREEYLNAKHNFEQAKKNFDSARVEREKSTIKAPISGVISHRHVSLGDTVFTGTPVVTIANLKILETELQIPQDQIEQISGRRTHAEVSPKASLSGAAGPSPGRG